MQFSVWTKRENFLDLLNSIQEEIKAAFDDAGVEIPFPHRSLHASSTTAPFPVRIVDRGDLGSRVTDFGGMELYAQSVIGTDPFFIAQNLRRNGS